MKITKKRLIIFILVSLLLLLSYCLMLAFFTIKAFKEVNKGNWMSAAKYGENIIISTEWLELICGDCDNSILRPVVAIRRGGKLLTETGRVLDKGQLIFQASLQNQPEIVQAQWHDFQNDGLDLLTQLNDFQIIVNELKLPALNRTQLLLKVIQENNQIIKKSLILFPRLIGLEDQDEKLYTIILQNDKEIRPTGGFMGSYLQLRFKEGALIDYSVEDIYVPDGAITGYISPPQPIQQAFQHGTWRLSNTNWDPDFPTAAETMSWFFDKGGVEAGEGMIALNFQVIEDILGVIGEVYVPDYQTSITPDNLYAITQYEAERDFFPGSIQKKEFLQHLADSLLFQNQEIGYQQLYSIAGIVYSHLQQRNIQFHFEDQGSQKLVREVGWSGEIIWPQLANQLQDYLFIVDANLGANKANCCVIRQAVQEVREREEIYDINLKINFINQNPTEKPNPPKHWGGDYKNYLRILLPIPAKIQAIQIGTDSLNQSPITIKSRPTQDLQSVGFFVNVPHLEQKEVEVKYILPKEKGSKPYQLFIQKQSGINYGQTIKYHALDGSIQETKRLVDQDQWVSF